MGTKIKSKYAEVQLNEEYCDDDKTAIWATISFAWGDKADPIAKAFGDSMDQVLLARVREKLAPLINVDSTIDIYLEDVDIMVNGFTKENKHLSMHLLGILKEAEQEFDRIAGIK